MESSFLFQSGVKNSSQISGLPTSAGFALVVIYHFPEYDITPSGYGFIALGICQTNAIMSL